MTSHHHKASSRSTAGGWSLLCAFHVASTQAFSQWNEALCKQPTHSRTENTVCIAAEEELGAIYQPRAN